MASGNRGPFEDPDGFDNSKRQHSGSPGSDGFDGVLPTTGFFNQPSSGVELEVLSSTSSHTRNDPLRLDQRTASDISSQAGHPTDHRPLIGGIGEVP
ncbi:hypothetical protein GGH91_003948, partial [Coemansia sp. RSA 2671]